VRFVIEHGIWVWGPLRRTARRVYLFSDCVILFISVTIIPQNALVILWSRAEELRQYDTDSALVSFLRNVVGEPEVW